MLRATAATPVAGTPPTPVTGSAIEQLGASGTATVPVPERVSRSRVGVTGWNLAGVTGARAVTGGTTRPSQAGGTVNQSDRRSRAPWNCTPVTVTVAAVPTTSIERTRPPSSPSPLRAVTRRSCKVPICGYTAWMVDTGTVADQL